MTIDRVDLHPIRLRQSYGGFSLPFPGGGFILLILFILSSPAFAAPSDELKKTEQAIEASRARQEKLAGDREKLEQELSDIQKQLVDAASSTQDAEVDVSAAQEKLKILDDQLRAKNKELAVKRKKLATLVQAATHLSKMPPEAMIMEPGNEHATKAARALKLTSDGIREEMKTIRVQTDELKRLRQKTASRRIDVNDKQKVLDKEKQDLKKRLAERQALQEKLGLQQEAEEKKVLELVKKAQNLQALVTNTDRAEQAPAASKGWVKKQKLRSFSAAKGQIKFPVAGKLLQRYGASKQVDTSRGIVIAAGSDEAQVVAPFDGQVVFTGPFLNYGKLVIIKHSDDFHTLLAGLSVIEADSGDFLLEGEPIGAMGNSESGRRLYVELRKNNQPIDPTPWIKGLNKKR